MYWTILLCFLNLDTFSFKVVVVVSWSTGGLTSLKNIDLLASHLLHYK